MTTDSKHDARLPYEPLCAWYEVILYAILVIPAVVVYTVLSLTIALVLGFVICVLLFPAVGVVFAYENTRHFCCNVWSPPVEEASEHESVLGSDLEAEEDVSFRIKQAIKAISTLKEESMTETDALLRKEKGMKAYAFFDDKEEAIKGYADTVYKTDGMTASGRDRMGRAELKSRACKPFPEHLRLQVKRSRPTRHEDHGFGNARFKGDALTESEKPHSIPSAVGPQTPKKKNSCLRKLSFKLENFMATDVFFDDGWK